MKHYTIQIQADQDHGNSIVFPSLIVDGERIIIIDAGFPDQADQFKSELQKLGYTINDLTDIIITHHDHDHIGSLSILKSINPDICIHAHKLEASYIEGLEPSLRLSQAQEINKTISGSDLEYGIAFVNYLKTIQSCIVDNYIDHNNPFENLEIINTPGHTPGHISIFVPDRSLIISGDAIVFENGKFSIPYPQFAFELENAKKSFKRLFDLKPELICCYHGGVNQNLPEFRSNYI